jgi:hypothetical protein
MGDLDVRLLLFHTGLPTWDNASGLFSSSYPPDKNHSSGVIPFFSGFGYGTMALSLSFPLLNWYACPMERTDADRHLR